MDGHRGTLIELEGHGREDVLDNVDVSGTVGWFTTRFPVWLEAGAEAEPGSALKRVKERLRSVPQKGLHWDMLERDSRPQLTPQVSFNYLGRFDVALEASGSLQFADEFAGSPVDSNDPDGPRHRHQRAGSRSVAHRQLALQPGRARREQCEAPRFLARSTASRAARALRVGRPVVDGV